MDEIGIWPRFAGRGMHDRFASYDAYDCAHSICGAHLVRDCVAVAEQEHQVWAGRCTTSCSICMTRVRSGVCAT
jgi:transposase